MFGSPEGTFHYRYLLEEKLKQVNENTNRNNKRIIISFKQHIIPLEKYMLEWKLKQGRRKEIKTRKTEKKYKQEACCLYYYLLSTLIPFLYFSE